MAFDRDTLHSIYSATHGYCHCCRRKLAFARFGADDGRGAWDIDATSPHPKSTALVPVCLGCRPRAPARPAPAPAPTPVPTDMSPRPDSATLSRGALIGGACGAVLGGLWGALLGGLVGATLEVRG